MRRGLPQLDQAYPLRLLRPRALGRPSGLVRHGHPRASGRRGQPHRRQHHGHQARHLRPPPKSRRCLKYYGDMDDTVARALDDISAGLAANASEKLLNMLDDDCTSWCTLILVQGYAKRNPIDVENHNVYLVSAMASDITELLLRSGHAL
uniref:Uncharacterized protein n=1 Tax=Avena sativa TaxID=4498 RepID=A0ACD5YYU6_AVESA